MWLQREKVPILMLILEALADKALHRWGKGGTPAQGLKSTKKVQDGRRGGKGGARAPRLLSSRVGEMARFLE